MTWTVTDPEFAEAVRLIDAGEIAALHAWLGVRPRLLEQTVPFECDPPAAYFAEPKLLWFVAENPIRNRRLPANIAEVAQTIVDLARAQGAADLQAQLDMTLSLVTSGLVPRECGVQAALVRVLAGAGANAEGALRPAAAHGEIAACEALLAAGAPLKLPIAAALGREDDVARLIEGADRESLQQALSLAAINGEAACTRLLLAAGADPSQFNAEGLHGHSTPLHQAINRGSLETVTVLVEAGAPTELRDKLFGGDALGWARHMGRAEIVVYLEALR